MANKLLCFFIVLFCATGTYYVMKHDLYLTQRLRIEPSFAGVDPFYLPVQKDLQHSLLPLQGQALWHTSLARIKKIIQADSRVKSFNIQRRLPGHYVLQMAPHRPVAVWLDAAGALHPLSDQAQLLRPTALRELPDVPVLKGAVFLKSLDARQKAVQLLNELPHRGWLSVQRVLELQYQERRGVVLSLRKTGNVQIIYMGHKLYRQKIKRLEQVLDYMQAKNLKNKFIDARFEKKVLVRLRNNPEAKGLYAVK